MLRPGRLDKLLYVPLPAAAERAEILKTVTSKMPVGGSARLFV
jgi:ribosome biogenesis ATPase